MAKGYKRFEDGETSSPREIELRELTAIETPEKSTIADTTQSELLSPLTDIGDNSGRSFLWGFLHNPVTPWRVRFIMIIFMVGFQMQKAFYFQWSYYYWANIVETSSGTKISSSEFVYAKVGGTIVSGLLIFAQPLIAQKMDTYSSARFGRRKPWIALFFVVQTAAMFGYIYHPNAGSMALVAWFATCNAVFACANTLFYTVLQAFIIEVTETPASRGELLCIVNTVWESTPIAFAAVNLLVGRFGYYTVYHWFAAIICPLSLVSVFLLKQLPVGYAGPAQSNVRVLPALLQAWSTKPLRLLLFITILEGMIIDPSQAPDKIFLLRLDSDNFAFTELLTGCLAFLIIPAFNFMGRYFEKKTLFCSSMVWWWIVTPGFLLLLPNPPPAMWPGIFYAITTSFSGARLQYEWSMVADAIEYDELVQGKRREALLISTKALVASITSILMDPVPTAILAVVSFEPNETGDVPEHITKVIRYMYGFKIIPAVVIGVLALRNPISKRASLQILAQLQMRRTNPHYVATDPITGEQLPTLRQHMGYVHMDLAKTSPTSPSDDVPLVSPIRSHRSDTPARTPTRLGDTPRGGDPARLPGSPIAEPVTALTPEEEEAEAEYWDWCHFVAFEKRLAAARGCTQHEQARWLMKWVLPQLFIVLASGVGGVCGGCLAFRNRSSLGVFEGASFVGCVNVAVLMFMLAAASIARYSAARRLSLVPRRGV